MVTPASVEVRKQLPKRIRAKKGPRDSLEIRLALADRIAALPGIETIEARPGAVPHRVEVWLRPMSASIRRRPDPARLCTISQDGVAVYGLADRERYRVLSRGWGRLQRDGVCVFLPRDQEELEVCWDILERAYRSFMDASAITDRRKVTPLGDLPRFSRTTLQ